MSHILPVDTTVDFYSTGGVADPFVLDSAESGVLGEDVLEGVAPVDITADVFSVTVRRGRSRWLDDVQAGTCSVSVENRDRDYDPTGGGTYSNDIVPGKRLRIKTNGIPIFDGTIDDWNLNYTIDGDATATAVASDAFSLLGRTKLDGFTATSQLAGERIVAILDRSEVQFPESDRDIDDGVQTLQADTVSAGTDVATYAKLVERTEGGRLFVSADGKLTFRNRRTATPSTAQATFDDTGTNIPYSNIGVQVGSELLFNRATVTRAGGTVQSADDVNSQDAYGIRTLDYTNLLFPDDADSQEFANFLVSRYGTARVRFELLEVNLARLSAAQCTTVLNLDLGEVVRVIYSPPGGGSAIDQFGVVDKIEHTVTVDSHRIRFSLSTALDTYFTLDDPEFGILQSLTLYDASAFTYDDPTMTYDDTKTLLTGNPLGY